MDHQTIIDALPEWWQAPVAAYLGSVRDSQQAHYAAHERYVRRERTNSSPGGPDGWTEPLAVAVDVAEDLRAWHWIDTYQSDAGDGFIVAVECGEDVFSFSFGPVDFTGILPMDTPISPAVPVEEGGQ